MTSFQSRLLGTWELLSFEGLNVDDPKDLAKLDLHGMITYTMDGYYSTVLVSSEEKTQDMQKLAQKIEASAGAFHLEETSENKATIHHEMEFAARTALVGSTTVRLGEMFDKDGETYFNFGCEKPYMIMGATRDVTIRWKKPKDQGTGSQGLKKPGNAGLKTADQSLGHQGYN